VQYMENLAVQLNIKGYCTEIEYVNGETMVNQHIKAVFKQKHQYEEKAKAQKRLGLQNTPVNSSQSHSNCLNDFREWTGSWGNSFHP